MRKVNWLKDQIAKKNGRVADCGSMSTGEVVDKATFVLRDLIGIRRDVLEHVWLHTLFYVQVYFPLKRFELSHYRNQVRSLFHFFIFLRFLPHT